MSQAASFEGLSGARRLCPGDSLGQVLAGGSVPGHKEPSGGRVLTVWQLSEVEATVF